MLVKINSM